MINDSECWAVNKKIEQWMGITEMIMLSEWMEWLENTK